MTSVSSNYDFVILGAGLSGLSLADRLADHDVRVLVLDRSIPGSGASNVPLGLINPAAGQRAGLCWRAAECYATAVSVLEKLQDFSNTQLMVHRGVLRPAIDEKSLSNFRMAYKNNPWPADWCRWLDAGDVEALNPYLTRQNGGLLIRSGCSVNMAEYVSAYAAYLDNRKKVDMLADANYKLKGMAGNRLVEISHNRPIRTNAVVFACGYAILRDYPCWSFLPLHGVKGQISLYASAGSLNWQTPTAIYGYYAPAGSGTFVAGGTYRHDFSDDQPGSGQQKAIEKKLDHLMPELARRSRLIHQWSGIRVTTPDRLPVIGLHPEQPELYIFTGLGSKGLLYSGITAGMLSDYLTDGKPVSDDVGLDRFAAKQ